MAGTSLYTSINGGAFFQSNVSYNGYTTFCRRLQVKFFLSQKTSCNWPSKEIRRIAFTRWIEVPLRLERSCFHFSQQRKDYCYVVERSSGGTGYRASSEQRMDCGSFNMCLENWKSSQSPWRALHLFYRHQPERRKSPDIVFIHLNPKQAVRSPTLSTLLA